MNKINIRNRGTPTKTNWEYRFEIPKIDGKRKYFSKCGFKTKKEAVIAGEKAYEEYKNNGMIISPSEMSISDYLDYWINIYVTPNLAYSTSCGYKNIIEKHLKPRIGYYKLKSADHSLLQETINEIYTQNNFTKGFMKNILKVICGSFKYAKNNAKFLNLNPALELKTPRFEPVPKKNKYIKEEDFLTILNYFKEMPEVYYALLIGYFTGLRISEVYGLTWHNINLEEKTITINKIAKRIDEKDKIYNEYWCLGGCKTRASYRTIQIGDVLAKKLLEYKAQQEKNRIEYGDCYIDYYIKGEKTSSNRTIYRIIPSNKIKESDKGWGKVSLVMVKENGEYHGNYSMKNPSKIINHKLGIDFNFHALRHTHATMLIENNVSLKTVQLRLGHSSSTVTMNTYIETTEKLKNSGVEVIDKAISKFLN